MILKLKSFQSGLLVYMYITTVKHDTVCVFRVMMVEALSEDLSTEDLMKYTEVCDFAFNFNFVVHLKSPASAEAIEEQILDWLQNLPAGKTANWVVRTCCQFFLCIASRVFERIYLSKLFASKLSIDPQYKE